LLTAIIKPDGCGAVQKGQGVRSTRPVVGRLQDQRLGEASSAGEFDSLVCVTLTLTSICTTVPGVTPA